VKSSQQQPLDTGDLQMDNMAAMTSAEARKLDLGLVVEKDSLKGVEETGAAVHDPDAHGLLIGHQYILDRPDSEGGPQVCILHYTKIS